MIMQLTIIISQLYLMKIILVNLLIIKIMKIYIILLAKKMDMLKITIRLMILAVNIL
jgi:hypothetical protein